MSGRWDPPPGSTSSRLPPVWAWGLRYSRQQRARFQNPAWDPGPVGTPDAADPQNTGTVSGLGGLPFPLTTLFHPNRCFLPISLSFPLLPHFLVSLPIAPSPFSPVSPYHPFAPQPLGFPPQPLTRFLLFPSLPVPGQDRALERCWLCPRAL